MSTFTTANHKLAPAFTIFGELLERRLHLKVFTTEDAVRYTFFVSLITTLDLKPEEIILEHDHSAIARAKVDTWIPNYQGIGYAIEFKYDRPIPSKWNPPLTQKAGQVLKDVFRLASGYAPQKSEAIFVYLTSREMASYFGNSSNGLADFFNLRVGASLMLNAKYLDGRAPTLRTAAGAIVPCGIDALLSCSLPLGHEVRAYAVRRTIGN